MSTSRVISVIMLALAAWGVFHAIGAYRFNHNPLRSLVVLATSLGFLGFWWLMLSARASRMARVARGAGQPPLPTAAPRGDSGSADRS